MNSSVDIITLTCNKMAYTAYCLQGLLRTSIRPLHIIIVDNGSLDNTPQLLKAFKAEAALHDIDVTLIFNAENQGAILGRNQALECIKGDTILFIDNDIVPADCGWAGDLAQFLHQHPEAGAVSPKLIYPVSPNQIQCAGCDVAPTGRVNFRGRGAERYDPAYQNISEVQALITACMAVPHAVINEVGAFDPLFSPVQFEDIDYCYRIKANERKLYYVPQPEIFHFENVTTSRSGSLNATYNTIKNGMKFKKKWKHIFARENGPDEAQMTWADIKAVQFQDVDSGIFKPFSPSSIE